MPLQVLLLLSLLGPGSSIPLLKTWKGGPPEFLLARAWRSLNQDPDFNVEDDYPLENTDPPEILENSTWAILSPVPLAGMGTLGQRVSVGPETPEPATVETATRDSAGLETLRTEPITQGTLVTQGSLIPELATTISPITEAPSTEPAATEAASMEPAATEAPSTEPAATEAASTEPAATEAPSTEPAATEAASMEPAATEAPFMEPTAAEALSTEPPATEAPSTEPAATEALPTEPAATEASSTEPTVTLPKESVTTEAPSTEPATTRGPATFLLGTSDPHHTTTAAASNPSDVFINQRENRQGLSPRSSAAPSPTGLPAHVPVRQCLLAILILALLATVFLVCTVVLAIRLSRRNHMYPVRSYSPTEMVCISSLLPDGAEAPAATANGGPPSAKGQGPKPAPQGDRDGDDLTLQSFLP